MSTQVNKGVLDSVVRRRRQEPTGRIPPLPRHMSVLLVKRARQEILRVIAATGFLAGVCKTLERTLGKLTGTLFTNTMSPSPVRLHCINATRTGALMASSNPFHAFPIQNRS